MILFDVIVVGSGPAGTFASYALRDKNVLMLDVGFTPPPSGDLKGNLFTLRQKEADLFHCLIGEGFEGMQNIRNRKISLKLKSPYMSYIIRKSEELAPIVSGSFEGMTSLAMGGLANAWGAGVYRFNDRDLQNFPVSARDLTPYYDQLTSHIGISGANDDLQRYFGHDEGLQEPMRISRFAAEFLGGYSRNRSYFNSRGIYVGLPRLAVLTSDHNGREKYRYEYLEFYKSMIPAVYTPAYTLKSLLADQSIQYRNNYLVTRYTERADHVEVIAKHLGNGGTETFMARRLILAAGALNTARIVLQSHNDYESRLPILDNQMSVILLFRPGLIGAKPDIEGTSLAQLNIVYSGPLSADTLQASLYGTQGPLRTDVLFDLPMTISANMSLIKYTAQASGAAMLFYPGKPGPGNFMRLKPDGSVEVQYDNHESGPPERLLIKSFRKIGYYGASFMCQTPKMGSGLHYAGMLPMKTAPGRYETNSRGLLSASDRVYIADGACFSGLPSKNLTFTIMANSMRIADLIRKELDL